MPSICTNGLGRSCSASGNFLKTRLSFALASKMVAGRYLLAAALALTPLATMAQEVFSSGNPPGAATSANQNSTAAGTSATNAQGVQGVTGGVAVKVDATQSGNVPVVVQGGTLGASAYYSNSLATNPTGFLAPAADVRGQFKNSETGSSDPLVGIAPAVAQSGTLLVGKASAGNLYSVTATLTAAASAQTYLVTINATSVPAANAAITPVDMAPFPGTAVATAAAVNYAAGPPSVYSTGIVHLVTTSLTTYTPGPASYILSRAR